MKHSDAIVFYHTSPINWEELQKRRRIHQAWIFFSIEPPPLTKKSVVPPLELDRIYNFTMSYRPSSSIHSPYGIYTPKSHIKGFKANRNWAKEKTGLVAWASSRCIGRGLHLQTWRRREFVETLGKHVSIDVYGNCGNKTCERHSDKCGSILGSHKFYLALENSECRDYITEKFWVNALRYNSVPIVYGPPREDYERVAPPNSFIHLQDFNNFSELVDYINLLDSTDTLYNTYFKWREKGSIRFEGEGKVLRPPFYCKMVNTLLENGNFSAEPKVERQHPSIHDFWTKSCIEPSGFPHDF
nr:glycoprotein 3-alpha-L-fucosyltransferase A-like [Lytechinus pictus]